MERVWGIAGITEFGSGVVVAIETLNSTFTTVLVPSSCRRARKAVETRENR